MLKSLTPTVAARSGAAVSVAKNVNVIGAPFANGGAGGVTIYTFTESGAIA